MRVWRTAKFVFAVALVVAMSGCGNQSGGSVAASGLPTDQPTVRHAEVSLVRDYSSLRELRGDSSLVVRVKANSDQQAVSASEDDSGDLESTLSAVTVLETYVGSAPVGGVLTVRQSGSKRMVFDGLAELLVPGDEYILFLSPFTFDRTGPGTGEWVVTGEVGAYRLQDGKFSRTASDAPDLPQTVSALNPLAD